MKKIAPVFLSSLLILAGMISIQAQDSPKHLTKSQASKLFPATLADYQLTDLKIKAKSTVWKEYSGTFKPSKKGKELKIVINDVIPSGDLRWFDQFYSTKDSISRYSVKEVQDGDKNSVLVLIGKRFRIDFKSREVSPEKLRVMAEAFDYAPISKLGDR